MDHMLGSLLRFNFNFHSLTVVLLFSHFFYFYKVLRLLIENLGFKSCIFWDSTVKM